MKIEEEIKGKFRNEYHKGLINLNYTAKYVSYRFLQTLKQHGLTEAQYNVLRVLRGFAAQGPANLGFVKERMLDKNSDVSRIVDKLVEKGWVLRSENGNDRRQKDISIAPAGLELLAQMLDCERNGDTLLRNLDPTEVKELNRLLDKIRD